MRKFQLVVFSIYFQSSLTISLNRASSRIQLKVGEHFAEIFFPASIAIIFFKNFKVFSLSRFAE